MLGLAITLHDLLHPYSGLGYQFWSGLGSDIGEVSIFGALVGGILAYWHHHNCHVHRCWRLCWHAHPGHGHPVCKRHHPHKVLPGGEVVVRATGEPA
jgi:hypothetical protein